MRKYILFLLPIIILIVIMMCDPILSMSEAHKQFKNFKNLDLKDIINIKICKKYNLDKYIEFDNIMKINEFISIIDYETTIMAMEKRNYPITFTYRVKTENNVYVFDLFKDKGDYFVNIFFRTKKGSVYLNGYDRNNILDELYKNM